MISAVFWDFGGVILSSPFEAFRRYESDRGLPVDTIRQINATDPHANAWARLERAEIDAAQFDEAFAAEAEAVGHTIRGADVLGLLAGEIRPAMVDALDTIKANGLRQACLTNNVVSMPGMTRPEIDAVMARFDAVIESSKVGVRKPEPAFYELACTTVGVTPDEVVFLDDLGVNLKPAAAMGMRTIKVIDPDDALAQLSDILSLDLATG